MTDKREQDAMEITERDKADFRQMVSEEPGLSGDPVWNVGYRLIAERRAALTRPASGDAVEARADAAEWMLRAGSKQMDRLIIALNEYNFGGNWEDWLNDARDWRANVDAHLATLTTEAPAQTEAMALGAIRAFLDAARQNIYPCPDKPDSLWGKWQAANEALATLRQPASVEAEPVAWRPIDEWDQRDELVFLLVDYRGDDSGGNIEDAQIGFTIGHNTDHNVGEGEGQGWQFAGWSWCHDEYIQGRGKPVAWRPIPKDWLGEQVDRIDAHLADQVQS